MRPAPNPAYSWCLLLGPLVAAEHNHCHWGSERPRGGGRESTSEGKIVPLSSTCIRYCSCNFNISTPGCRPAGCGKRRDGVCLQGFGGESVELVHTMVGDTCPLSPFLVLVECWCWWGFVWLVEFRTVDPSIFGLLAALVLDG